MAGSGPSATREPIPRRTVLDDRFEIGELLGKGGFGEVYEAKQLLFGQGVRRVALKLFAEGKVTRDNAREVLNDALHVLGLIEESPDLEVAAHLVQVYDMGVLSVPSGSGTLTSRAFVSMRLIPGKRTLKSEIYRFRHSAGMPVTLSLRYMRELLKPLAWMHCLEEPAVHGDLKPENVMLTPESKLVLVDFGLAARMPIGVRGGTLAYDPSEKLLDLPGGPAADVYSAGLIWYELLTGLHPFKDVGLQELASGDDAGYRQAHIAARRWPICSRGNLPLAEESQRIAPASELNRDLADHHPQVELLLNACLADDLSVRLQNARLLLDSIDRYATSGGLPPTELEVILGGDSGQSSHLRPTQSREVTLPSSGDVKALLAQRRVTDALAMAEQLVKLVPEGVDAHLSLAEARLAVGQIAKAQEACERAMSRSPSRDPRIFEVLAKICDAQGKPTQANGYRKTASDIRRQAVTGKR